MTSKWYSSNANRIYLTTRQQVYCVQQGIFCLRQHVQKAVVPLAICKLVSILSETPTLRIKPEIRQEKVRRAKPSVMQLRTSREIKQPEGVNEDMDFGMRLEHLESQKVGVAQPWRPSLRCSGFWSRPFALGVWERHDCGSAAEMRCCFHWYLLHWDSALL